MFCSPYAQIHLGLTIVKLLPFSSHPISTFRSRLTNYVSWIFSRILFLCLRYCFRNIFMCVFCFPLVGWCQREAFHMILLNIYFPVYLEITTFSFSCCVPIAKNLLWVSILFERHKTPLILVSECMENFFLRFPFYRDYFCGKSRNAISSCHSVAQSEKQHQVTTLRHGLWVRIELIFYVNILAK